MAQAAKGISAEQAIQNRVDEFVNAWNKHDARAMSMVYAEDADMINPAGRVAKSRTEIEQLLRDEHSRGLKDSHMSLRSEGVRLLAPDIAVSDHAFEVTGARDPSGKEVSMQGHLTIVLEKQGNEWLASVCRPMILMPGLESK